MHETEEDLTTNIESRQASRVDESDSSVCVSPTPALGLLTSRLAVHNSD